MPRAITESSPPKLQLYFAKKRNICKLLYISLRKHRSIAEDKFFGTGNIYAEYVYPRNMNLIKKNLQGFLSLLFVVVLLRFLSYHFDLNQGLTRNHGRKLILDLSITSSHVKRLDKQTVQIRICSVIILKDNYRPLGHFERGEQSDAFISHFVARNEK